MTTYIDSHIITLTSDTATLINAPLNSDANFEFRGLLRDESSIIQRQISILSAQIPVSFYNVNEYNNFLKLKVYSVYYDITIPVGNYNANTLIAYIQNELNTIPNMIVAIDKVTGKIGFTLPDPSNDAFLEFSKESTCQELLGFKPNLDYTDERIIVNFNYFRVLKSPYPMNLLGPKVLSIKSPSLNTSNISSINKTVTTLLGTIPIDATLFGQVDYHNYSNLRTSFNNTDLNNLEIQIYDEKNNLIDFNGVNWAISLAIHLTKTYDIPIKKGFVDTSQPLNNIKEKPKELSPEDKILFS